MAQNKFKGLGVALVTPFNADGSIDWDSLFRLVEYQISRGIDFLCVMGTTAETPTLTSEEKKRIREEIVQRVAGRVPILLGCGLYLLGILRREDLRWIRGLIRKK